MLEPSVATLPVNDSDSGKHTDKESGSDDEDDDVEDEVFIREGRGGGKKSSIMGGKFQMKMHKLTQSAEIPLMRPKRRGQYRRIPNRSLRGHAQHYWNPRGCLLPIYYALIAFVATATTMMLYVLFVKKFPTLFVQPKIGSDTLKMKEEPCKNMRLEPIWNVTFPNLKSETQTKLSDVNNDGIFDVIVGFGTELDDIKDGDRMCDHYFGKGIETCYGGLLALDGTNGDVIWQKWLDKMILSVHCNVELTNDDTMDCVVTGKGGLLLAVNGMNGETIWDLKRAETELTLDIFNILVTSDLNEDGLPDIICTHIAGNTQPEMKGHLMVISGRDGVLLQSVGTPGKNGEAELLFNAPQLFPKNDGEEAVLFTTGDSVSPGGLYIVSLRDLLAGNEDKIRSIQHGNIGIPCSPVFSDVTLDGINDVVFAFSDSIVALNGKDFTEFWTVPLEEFVGDVNEQITVTSSLTAAYFNNDLTPDFMLTFASGAGFPSYYYSVTIVIDGRTGNSLLKEPVTTSGITDTVVAASLRFDEPGDDYFLYWVASCRGHENDRDSFMFDPRYPDHLSMADQADYCSLRFNATTQLDLYALNERVKRPGILLYHAEGQQNGNLKNAVKNMERDPIGLNKMSYSYHKATNPRFNHPSSKNSKAKLSLVGKFHKKWDLNHESWKTKKPYHNENWYNNLYDAAPQEQSLEYKLQQMPAIAAENDEVISRFPRNARNSASDAYKLIPKVSAAVLIADSIQGSGMDVIFTTYDVPATNNLNLIFGKDVECVENFISSVTDPKGKNYATSLDAMLTLAAKDCLDKKPEDLSRFFPDQNLPKYTEPQIMMGSLYVFRSRVICDCEPDAPNCPSTAKNKGSEAQSHAAKTTP